VPRFPRVWRLRKRMLDIDTVRFPDGLVKTNLTLGPAVYVFPNDVIGRNIFYRGLWEESTTLHFYNGLRAGDTVLDVGANIGQYAVLAATRVGPGGTVFAVEPGMTARAVLERNVALNGLGNVRVFPVAAWDSDTTLYLDAGRPGNCGSAEVSRDWSAAPAAVPVPARRLGPLLRAAGGTRIDVLKIDIEGAELPALRGLEDVFRTEPPRAVYCELLGGHDRFGETAHDLIGFFDRFGYRAWAFGDDGLRPLDRERIGADTMVNVFLERA